MDRIFKHVLALSLLLTACGPTRPEGVIVPTGASSAVGKAPTPPQFKAPSDWIPEKIELACAGNQCPPGVGLLLFATPVKNGFEVTRCTASLIGANLVLSNAHCDLLPADGYFVLPGRRQVSRIKRTVTKILSPEKGIDVAVFQLEAEIGEVAPLKLASGPQANYTNLIAYVVNPRGTSELSFQVDRISCDFKFHVRDFPYHISESPNVLAGAGCDSQKGNSGSPFLNARTGAVEAVLQAKGTGDTKYTYATNLRCVGILKQDPLDCVSVTDAESDRRFISAQRQAFEKLKSLAPSEADDRLGYQAYPYQMSGSTQDFEVLYMPKCRKIRDSIIQLSEVQFPSELMKMIYNSDGGIDWQRVSLRWNKALVEPTQQGMAIFTNTNWAKAFGTLRGESSHPRSAWGASFTIDLPQCAR